ncbi:MAG: hypothetical protein WAZ14_02825 [Patescibacteria group bacterium]
MLGIVLNLPPYVENYLATTPIESMAAQAILLFGWFPIFGVLVWGMAHVWLDFKQDKYSAAQKYVMLDVRVPQTAIQTPKGMDIFFANLSGSRSSITWREKWLLGKEQPVFSFEIASNEGRIQFIIRCTDKYRDLVEADIYAQYPEAQITEIADYTGVIPKAYPDEEWEAFGAEFVLKNANHFPIRTFMDFEHQGEKEGRFKDPLLPILELMGKMRPGEHFWIQMLIQAPDSQDWTKDGAKFASTIMGKEEKKVKSMTQELGEMVGSLPMDVLGQMTGASSPNAKPEKKSDDFKMFKLTPAEKLQIDSVTEKISKLGWKTKIRIVYAAKKSTFRKGMMASGMKGIMASYTNSIVNSFSMHGPSIPKDDYFWMAWQYPGKQTKLAKRFAGRSFGPGSTAFILNTEELATFWHFPAADARTPVLAAMGARRAEAPADLYFADDLDGDGIPDWKQKHGKSLPGVGLAAEAESPVRLPTPLSPTGAAGAMPQPGKPAPLPPGLDLSDEPLDPRNIAPGNLPV